MDNIIYILFVSISVPIMLMALLVEKKARLPITFILVGIFVSVFALETEKFIFITRNPIRCLIRAIKKHLDTIL